MGNVLALGRRPAAADAPLGLYHVAPHLSGRLLRVAAWMVSRLWPARMLMMYLNGFYSFHRCLTADDYPLRMPCHLLPQTAAAATIVDSEAQLQQRFLVESELHVQPAPAAGFHYNSVLDYCQAYKCGSSTPVDVVLNLLRYIDESNSGPKPLRAVVEHVDKDLLLSWAQASTERWRAGKPLSLFDGIPVIFKDQLRVKHLHVAAGCSYVEREPAQQDATVVARLRAQGALIFGKGNMTEFGLSTAGVNGNARYGNARNPYNPDFLTGGSSAGCAAAVSAGLCPVAIGVDGGGSIRIPSSCCGVVGLKPTCGRTSLFGDIVCLGGTIDVAGPIGANARDCALALAAIAGEDVNDPVTLCTPSLDLKALTRDTAPADLSGVNIGVYRKWFDAVVDVDAKNPEVKTVCNKFLDQLRARGATILEEGIVIPHLREAQAAHALTIVSEVVACAPSRDRLLPSTQLMFAIGGDFTSVQLECAARMRCHACRDWASVFEKVDFVVTPALGCLPPRCPDGLAAHDDDLDIGPQSLRMQYMFPANFCGLPAVVFPIAFHSEAQGGSVPLALQLIGKPWSEPLLLRVAELLAPTVVRPAPQIYYDLLAPLPAGTPPVAADADTHEPKKTI
eukprot:TRINITY_DN18720_c0_g1_i1.p1 TRINITY_DN18720_c0_g1~~TRINITY_DN18720_c0_g1_i1.p1  ORF type:complete len:621 (+),score=108.63 TRINITY_DN18720_c0_g1_i1:27-1889(+)